MSGDHIVKSFDEDLGGMTAKVQELMSMTEEQINRALKAVADSDEDLARDVVAKDKEVNALERETHEMGARLLALREPKGRDLRFVIAAMRTVVDVERIGDYAVNIVSRAPLVRKDIPKTVVDELERIGDIVSSMLVELRQAFSTGNIAKAVEIWKQDDQVDRLYAALLIQTRAHMESLEDGERLALYEDVVFIAKALERMGDHLTNVAEHIYEMVEGRPLDDALNRGRPE